MTRIVPRTCTETTANERRGGQPLADFRKRGAYVLLGEPGAGKTVAFKAEAEATGGVWITARDFVALAPDPAWRGRMLYVDGFDEMRAGAADGAAPLDAIRRRLDDLGRPPFRLSCREADWWGASDREALARVAPGGAIDVLHLDPLTREQAALLLAANHGEVDPQGFLDHAAAVRLDALASNPQTLGLLAAAVKKGWPESRAQTYEAACRELAREENPAHRRAKSAAAVGIDDLLATAGRLCAVQLLAGLAGYALDAAAADEAHPVPGEVGLGNSAAERAALHSMLFAGGAREEQREPLHRSVAEYLGARYLAERIARQGLPLERVLALMAADDGGIVSGLRGLHAWLAVHAPSTARAALIDGDPLGVVLYGDARGFPRDDKRRLFAALHREAVRFPWFRHSDWTASPFGALASSELADLFREHLAASDRSEGQQALVDCVLDALVHGDPMPEFAEQLLDVVRDGSRWLRIRTQALEALFRLAPLPVGCLQLLDDIQAGIVEDGEDELAGRLLAGLYPAHIPVSRIFDYFRQSKQPEQISAYADFWTDDLAVRTPVEFLPGLADQLAQRRAGFSEILRGFLFNRMPGAVLLRTLAAHGDSVAIPRLWTWLGIALDEHQHCDLEHEHIEGIGAWLSARPGLCRSLLGHGLTLCSDLESSWICILNCQRRLLGVAAQPELGNWLLDCAQTATADGMRHDLFALGLRALIARDGPTPALLERVLDWVAEHPEFEQDLQGSLSEPIEDGRYEHAHSRAKHRAEQQKGLDDWLGFFRTHRAAISNASAPPKAMHDLAMVYFGRYREGKGDNPIERLRSFMQDDAALVLETLVGLRRCLDRSDLPSVDEIVDLNIKGRHYFLGTACLAGAEEAYRSMPEAFPTMDDSVLEKLVAFRISEDFGNTPDWFKALVAERPELIARVGAKYVARLLKAGREHLPLVYPMAYDAAYAQVATLAVPPLLEGFPARAGKKAIGALQPLLRAALKHMDQLQLADLVARRLALTSLDAAQRIDWLTAGLLIDPARYMAPMERYAGHKEAHTRRLAAFFNDRGDRGGKFPPLTDSAMILLVKLVGPHCVAERPVGTHRVSPAMETAVLVRSLIASLGASTEDAAAAGLAGLLDIKALAHWHGDIRRALESQRLARREGRFRHAAPLEVVRTLENRRPANVADLMALTLAHLDDLARETRDGNTLGYRRYWNIDEHQRPTTPRHEEDCRNRLLELLRERLRGTDVDAQPETRQADATRADIGLSCGSLRLPIEIKRQSHPDLWTALHDQLIADYARDPDAAGHGIYLVFWFGSDQKQATARDGRPRPASVTELQARLAARLGAEESYRIAVRVLDCAPPQSA